MHKPALLALFLLAAGSADALACSNWLGLPCGSKWELIDALRAEERDRLYLEVTRPRAPERMPDANTILQRQAAWVERCKPQIETDARGTSRRVYAEPGCELGPR